MLKEWIDIIQLFFAKSRNVLKKDINGEDIKNIWISYTIFIIITLLFVWGIPNGFSNGFLDYATSILSIFVGFFITVLVFVEDKLKPIKLPSQEEENAKPANERLTQKHAFSLNISEYTIIDNISQLSLNSILMGFYFWSMIIYRIVVLYLMLKIFFYTSYATSSLVSVIILKRKM